MGIVGLSFSAAGLFGSLCTSGFVSDVGLWLSDVDFWLSDVGLWLSDVGFLLSFLQLLLTSEQ